MTSAATVDRTKIPIGRDSLVMVEVGTVSNRKDLREEWVVEKDGKHYYCGLIIGLTMSVEDNNIRIRLYVKPDLSANSDDVRIITEGDDAMTIYIAHTVTLVKTGEK
jgi:hypothetical protein